MLSPHSRLHRNQEEVAAKVIDGEAIIINLSNGMYYSMDKVGASIWTMIEDGYSLDEMATALGARYAVSREQAQADVERLAAELLKEALVVLAEGAAAAAHACETQAPNKLSYESPTLNIYRDMGDLLALDPPVPTLKDIPWKEPSDESSG